MGNSSYDFSMSGRDTDEISSGPNKGYKYVKTQNISTPLTVSINQYFSDPSPPQSWIDFRNAQGGPGEPEYSEIEPAVKKHEGYQGTGDLVTDSHYKYWHVDVIKKGTSDDPRARVEKMGTYDLTLEAFDQLVRDWVFEYGVGAQQTMSNHEPDDYLDGEIDFTYPD